MNFKQLLRNDHIPIEKPINALFQICRRNYQREEKLSLGLEIGAKEKIFPLLGPCLPSRRRYPSGARKYFFHSPSFSTPSIREKRVCEDEFLLPCKIKKALLLFALSPRVGEEGEEERKVIIAGREPRKGEKKDLKRNPKCCVGNESASDPP